jgi:hypothetical protein
MEQRGEIMPDAESVEKEGAAVEQGSSTEIVPSAAPRAKNPRRVAAGKLNHTKRRGFTDEGLARLREAALVTRPWQLATGPRTPAGKAKSAQNWHSRKAGIRAYCELRRAIQELTAPSAAMRRLFEDFLEEVDSNSAAD